MSAQNVRYSTVKIASARVKSGCLPRPVAVAGSSQRGERMPTVGAGHGNWASTIGALKRLGFGFPESPRRGVLTNQPHAWHAGRVRDVAHDAVRVHSDGSVERPAGQMRLSTEDCLAGQGGQNTESEIRDFLLRCFKSDGQIIEFMRYQFGDRTVNALIDRGRSDFFGQYHQAKSLSELWKPSEAEVVSWFVEQITAEARNVRLSHDQLMDSLRTYAVINLLGDIFISKQGSELEVFAKYLGVDVSQMPTVLSSVNCRAAGLVALLRASGKIDKTFFAKLREIDPKRLALIQSIEQRVVGKISSGMVGDHINPAEAKSKISDLEARLKSDHPSLVDLADIFLEAYDGQGLVTMFKQIDQELFYKQRFGDISNREFALKMAELLFINKKIDDAFFKMLKTRLPQHAAALDYLASQIHPRN